MKGELILVDDIDIEYNDAEFDLLLSCHDFSLSIYINNEKSLEKQLKNREEYDRCISILKASLVDFSLLDDKINEQIEYVSKNFDNIFESVEYVKLLFCKNDVLKYIMDNPSLLSKKIVLNEVLNIDDYDVLMNLMNKYENYIDKIYVSLVGNDNYVSLTDCYKTMKKIKDEAECIKKLCLSPMETIMYVYDKVRSRVYTYEKEDESVFKSRDLSEVMFGDKIVCAGYSNIFSVLLTYLGIDNKVVHLKSFDSSKYGHARNVVYVQDAKYDIDGVYYFDATNDSRCEDETYEYLFRYLFFAKTKHFMDKNDENYLIDINLPAFSADMCDKIKKSIDSSDYETFLKYSKSLNFMSKLIDGSSLIGLDVLLPVGGKFNYKEVLEKFKVLYKKFNKSISAETVLKLLYNVRRVEYYENPELYPYSLNHMIKTFKINNWNFESDAKERLLCAIYGEKFETDPIKKFSDYCFEHDLFEDMERVRLAKTLSLVYEKKSNKVAK